MSENDESIEQLLQAAGARWRSTIVVSEDLDVEPLRGRRPGTPRRLAVVFAELSAVAAVLAVFAWILAPQLWTPGNASSPAPTHVAGVSASPTPPPSPTAQASGTEHPSASGAARTPFEDAAVHPGDFVEASGIIIDDHMASPKICLELSHRSRRPSCAGPPGVEVRGIDWNDIDGNEEFGVSRSKYVMVHGVWLGDAIDATSVVSASDPTFDEPVVTCPTPRDGWSGGGDANEMAEASARVHAYVAGRPTLYSGTWTAVLEPPAASSEQPVLMVGTTGDPEVESEALRQLYPFNLCVTGAEFSAAEMTALQNQLQAEEGLWVVDFRPYIDRVVVELSVLDESAARVLSQYVDMISVRAIVTAAT